jgi:hypothetical protein
VQGNFDALRHTTIADLLWCVTHELDLYVEGEPCDIRNQRDLRAAKAYFTYLTDKEYRHDQDIPVVSQGTLAQLRARK